jgi:acyl-CoA thioesterase FadM
MADTFAVRIRARGYEVDSNGHVAGTVLMQYGQHARWECLRAVGRESTRGSRPVTEIKPEDRRRKWPLKT